MGATTRFAAFGLGVLLLVGVAHRGSQAFPDEPPAELWKLIGIYNTRGVFMGMFALHVSKEGAVSVSETLTFADKSTLSWVGTGELKGNDVHFKGPQSIGLIGAIEGDKNAKPKGLHG